MLESTRAAALKSKIGKISLKGASLALLSAGESQDPDLDAGRKALGTYNVENCNKTLKPSVLYIGQGHSGSTSLAVQMDAHPHISTGKVKEHMKGNALFCGEPVSDPILPSDPNGIPMTNGSDYDKYLADFVVPCETKVSIDFSAGVYLSTVCTGDILSLESYHVSNLAPQLVKRYLGDVKLIVMFRDPVDFLVSLRDGEPEGSLWLPLVGKTGQDCYADSVEIWLRYFQKKDILFIKAEDYFKNNQATLDQIFEFLGMEPFALSGAAIAGRRRTSKRSISMEERRAYHTTARQVDCKRRLEAMTGLEFPWPGSISEAQMSDVQRGNLPAKTLAANHPRD
jgi:hypothetical protein